MTTYSTNFRIDDEIEFRRDSDSEYISGRIVAIKFTKMKVLYSILSDYDSYVKDNIDSLNVKLKNSNN